MNAEASRIAMAPRSARNREGAEAPPRSSPSRSLVPETRFAPRARRGFESADRILAPLEPHWEWIGERSFRTGGVRTAISWCETTRNRVRGSARTWSLPFLVIAALAVSFPALSRFASGEGIGICGGTTDDSSTSAVPSGENDRAVAEPAPTAARNGADSDGVAADGTVDGTIDDASTGSIGERARLEWRRRAAETELARLEGRPPPTMMGVATSDIEAAAAAWIPQPLPAELSRDLQTIIEQLDAPALFEWLLGELGNGVEGYTRLRNTAHFLEENERLAFTASTHYMLMFATIQAALLDERATAEFLHFYLLSSRASYQRWLRQRVFEAIPRFLRFFRGQFLDLELALRKDIHWQLGQPNIDPRRLFDACRTIEYAPQLLHVENLLTRASTLQHWLAIFSYLESRDGREALGIVVRFIDGREKSGDVGFEVDSALQSIARMKVDVAPRAIEHFMSSKDARIRRAALRAWFVEKRGDESVERLLAHLRTEDDVRAAKILVEYVATTNPLVLAKLLDRVEEISSSEVRDLVQRVIKSL
jgi:hypothetical protein